MKNYTISLLLIPIIFLSCSPRQAVDDNLATGMEADSGIVLSRESATLAGIRFGDIEPRLLSMDVNARGRLELLPRKMATISTMISGSIQSIDVEFGQQVKKGDALATYSSHEFLEMQQRYLNSMTKLEKVENDFERKKSLYAENVISEKEYQEVKLEYNNAKVDLDASRAEMELLKINLVSLENGMIQRSIPLKSPISGQVESINVNLGEFVAAGTPVFKVIDKSAPMLKLMIFEKDISKVNTGQRVTFSLPDRPDMEFEAEIYAIGSTVDPAARVVQAYARVLKAPRDLISGMFVATEIHTSESMRNALPVSAVVVENENRKYGFYSLDEDAADELHFYRIALECGFEEDGYIEVWPAYPLPDKARMVITGTYYLKSELLRSYGE